MELNKRIRQNALKVAFIAQTYPEKNIIEISQVFQTSPIEFNAAAWAAQDIGYFTVAPDNSIQLGDIPENWGELDELDELFGELVEHLMVELPYVLKKLNAEEADIEEEYLGNWAAGFPAQDVIIATKLLLAQNKIASYEVKNETHIKPNREQRRAGVEEKTIVDTYVFYTLPENIDKRWGEKQFEDKELLQKVEG
jgi:hypothetical protein